MLSSEAYLSPSLSYISLTVSTTSFQLLLSCASCPGLIVVALSLAIMVSFVPADQMPIRTERVSYFHLALMIFTCPKLLSFSSKYLASPWWKRSRAFPIFPFWGRHVIQQSVKILRCAEEAGAVCFLGQVQKKEIRSIYNRAGVSYSLYNPQLYKVQLGLQLQKLKEWADRLCRTHLPKKLNLTVPENKLLHAVLRLG